MSFLKPTIKRLLASCGYGLYKINPTKTANAQGLSVTNALDHNSLEQVNRFYDSDEIVDCYLADDRLLHYQQIAEMISDLRGAQFNGSVADVGCGTGHQLSAIGHLMPDAHLHGLEFSSSALKRCAQTNARINTHEYNIYSAWTDDPFDVVLCSQVLEHLQHPSKAFRHLQNMTKNTGILILSVPNGRIDTFDGHINFWSPESWDIFLKKHSETSSVIKTRLTADNKVLLTTIHE